MVCLCDRICASVCVCDCWFSVCAYVVYLIRRTIEVLWIAKITNEETNDNMSFNAKYNYNFYNWQKILQYWHPGVFCFFFLKIFPPSYLQQRKTAKKFHENENHQQNSFYVGLYIKFLTRLLWEIISQIFLTSKLEWDRDVFYHCHLLDDERNNSRSIQRHTVVSDFSTRRPGLRGRHNGTVNHLQWQWRKDG